VATLGAATGATPAAPEGGTQEPSASGPSAGGPGAPRALVSVGGVPMTAEDVLVEWYQLAGRDVLQLVDRMVATRLAFVSADELGLVLAPELVEARVAEERARFERELRAARGADVDVEGFLQDELGQTAAVYFERLRRATVRQMVAERVVRAWTLAHENARLRVLVVGSEAELAEVEARLAAGADFTQLARELSRDDTAEDGGFLPFLVHEERSPLARLAFATPVGEVGGPLAEEGRWILLRVEEQRAALAGDWRAVGAAVEASLARDGLHDSEFLHWKLVREREVPIDLGPLRALLGGGAQAAEEP
jgi:hypothetical protein